MKILTAKEMREADLATVDQTSMTSYQLMENAGAAVARLVLKEYPECRRVTVLCGKGNNGGDGLVAARILSESGVSISVLLLGDPGELKGDAESALLRLPFPVTTVPDEKAVHSELILRLLGAAELFLDALVGTGFQPPLRGSTAALRDRINSLEAPVVAVDLPSGWNADSRDPDASGAFRADAVVTFTAPKLAHLFGNMTRGGIVVAPIGSPPEAVQSTTNLRWGGASARITHQGRVPDSNKGMYGHVLVIGGAKGTAGAAAMASLAALRAGAGLVTAAIPESTLPTVARAALELMTVPMMEGDHGEISSANLASDRLQALLERITVLAIGPGLSQHPETAKFVFALLNLAKQPMVLDADALNMLAKDLSKLSGRERTIVITPHPGEMARLVGGTIQEVQADRERISRDFALRHSITVVLKGWRTLIAHPDGSIAINTTGNPGMAKGGSGDILTGIVAAMLAQYARDGQPASVASAVEAAVYLHGLAADLAVLQQDEHTLLATDTVSHLCNAFRFRAEDKAGYVWLQGVPQCLKAKQ